MEKKRFLCALLLLIVIIVMLPITTNAKVTVELNGYTLTVDGYHLNASTNPINELRILSFERQEDSSICINARIIFKRYGSSNIDIIFPLDTNCSLNYKEVGKHSLYDNITFTLYRSAKDHIDENNDHICDFCKQNNFINFGIADFNKATRTATVLIATAGTYTILFADYGENKALSNVETKIITTTGAEVVPTSITKGFMLGEGDKIMLWNNMTGLVPYCNTFVIE